MVHVGNDGDVTNIFHMNKIVSNTLFQGAKLRKNILSVVVVPEVFVSVSVEKPPLFRVSCPTPRVFFDCRGVGCT